MSDLIKGNCELQRTKDEIVDVVDENNRILYQVTKHEAHQSGLLHRTVIGKLFDSQGQEALVKQADHKQDAGQYVSLIGGHALHGETEEEALNREALEEAGLKDFKFELKGRFIYSREVSGRKENHYFIVFEIYSDDPILLGNEAVECKYWSQEELLRDIRTNPDNFGAAFYQVINKLYPELLDVESARAASTAL